MCLATVYEEKMDNGSVLCRNITKIDIDGETIKFTDILGAEIVYTGRIISAELCGGTIILKRPEGAA